MSEHEIEWVQASLAREEQARALAVQLCKAEGVEGIPWIWMQRAYRALDFLDEPGRQARSGEGLSISDEVRTQLRLARADACERLPANTNSVEFARVEGEIQTLDAVLEGRYWS